MKYTIYANDNLIFNQSVCDERGRLVYSVIEPTLDERTDGFNSLTYRCLRGTPAYDRSVEMTTKLKVYEDGNLYWAGRIISVQKTINNDKVVYAEDTLALLCDAIYEPFEFYGTVSDLLSNIVGKYNSSVDESKRFVGVVCDVDVGNITRSCEGYETCWSIIKTRLLNMVGGYMWVSYNAEEKPIIHYSLSQRNASTQVISFGSNLKDYSVKWSFDGFYTACVPLGAKNEETKEYVTIESVNDGNKNLIDSASAAIYGIIYAPPSETTWKDVHEPSILLQRGQEWIQTRASRAVRQISLDGVDLATLGVNVMSIHWLDKVRCTCSDFDEMFILESVSRRLDDISSVNVSMGSEKTSLTGSNISMESSTINRIENIEADYTTAEDVSNLVQPKIDDLMEETLTQITSIRQEANQIVMQAIQEYSATNDANLEALYERISSELNILADRVEFNFNSTNESITNVDGTYRGEIDNILSFIRLLPTTQTQQGGVVIGESTSEIKLKLENDVLYFFTGDETNVSTENAIAYFAAGQLVVNEAILRVVSIGIPGAMMHFSVVGSGSLQCLFLSPRRVE